MLPGRTRVGVIALAALAGLAVGSCANILGIEDRTLDPLAEGGGGDGGTGCADPCPMATGLNHPFSVTADETNVYWVESGDTTDYNGTVKSCSVTGCGAGPTVYASLQAAPGFIAVDGQNVYWGTSNGNGTGGIWSCTIGGCGGKPTMLAPADAPFGIAVDSTYVYWAEYYTQTVNRAPLAGGSSSLVWDAGTVSGGGTPPNGATALTINPGFVYINDQNASTFRVAIGGGTLIPMFTDPNGSGTGVFGLAVDSNDLYLGASGGIYQMSKGATSGATALAPNVTLADYLAVDPSGGALYWADYGNAGTDGTVGMVPLDGGAPVLLHQQLVTPEALAVNSTDVFWVSYGAVEADGTTVKPSSGTLYRTAK